ncbi:AAA family ATPase [Verrucosispora sp. WMMA2121]|nr:AAA family ATPase [Verrucosispora sp. WMMA2121]MCZ7421118.1 AAA family ATPase [Verrucosispora sp. WMMA2121]
MHLRSLRIRGFRNFADLAIDPFPTPAVIVGENGAGKTNLLYALRLVLDPGLADRYRQLQADDVHSSGSTLAQGVTVTIQVELAGFDDDLDARSELEGAIVSADGDSMVARLTYLFQPKTSLGVVLGMPFERELTPDDYLWTIYGADDPDNAMPAAKRYASLSVLQAMRDAESDLQRGDRNPLTQLLRELPPSEKNLARALDEMSRARERLGRDPNVREIERLLLDRLTKMAGPQLGVQPSLAFAGRKEDLLRSVRLFVDANATRGIDRTSTGAANIVYIALLLEKLQARREADSGEDTILAVEEPEAHLHPTLQRHVFAHLLSEFDDLILTTHSPHIAAVSPLHSFILIARIGDASQAHIVPPGILTDLQTRDLERYLNVTRAEILFARRIILVEGAADSYLLPALAHSTGFNLDAHGIVVASVEGTDFMPYIRLLGTKGLNRPVVVLTDGDTTDSSKIDKAEFGLSRVRDLLEHHAVDIYPTFKAKLGKITPGRLPDGDQRTGRPRLVELAAKRGIYVGHRTLELDVVPLLKDEIYAAFEDLFPGTTKRKNIKSAIDAVVDGQGGPSTAAGEKLLSYVEEVGKGRFAQRLAAHVQEIDDLRDRVIELLDYDEEDALATADLLDVPGCGPLLALLNDLRTQVEEMPLLPTCEEYQDAIDDDDDTQDEEDDHDDDDWDEA